MVLLLQCFLYQVQQSKFKVSARLLCVVSLNMFLLQSGNNMSAFKRADEKKQEMEIHETKSLLELLLEHLSMAVIEPKSLFLAG